MLSRDSLVRGGLPVFIGAIVCLGFARSGFFAPFFLLPIGFLAYRVGVGKAWLAAFAAVAANALFSVLDLRAPGGSIHVFLVDSLYFSAVTFSFVWFVAPRGPRGGVRRFRLAYRGIAAAVFSAMSTIPVIALARNDEGLVAQIRRQAEGFISAYSESAGADVVQRSLIERSLSADAIIAAVGEIYLRGAAVFGHAVFFFVSWRIALFFSAFRDPSLRRRGAFSLFHLDSFVIWPLIAAFITVLGGLTLKVGPLEIFGWNLLSICLLLYSAQGYGIVQYQLARPGVPRSFGPLVTLLVALALLSPGINAIVAGAIAALGIAENWLPLRAPIKTEPPSTPGA